MLDRRFVRENSDAVREAARLKGVDIDVDAINELDGRVRSLQREVDESQRERRELAAAFKGADAARREDLRIASTALDARLREARANLETASGELRDLLLRAPAIPWSGAPVGPDESANVVIRTWGEPPTFDFTPLDHVELAEKRGWAEFTRARSVAGERAYALASEAVLLERALHSFALDVLRQRDFRVMAVPSLVREEALVGSGFLPGHREEIYHLAADDLYLAGTAEVALVGLHSGEVLAERDLPIRYAGISPCFRREVGSAGRDVRGFIRVHQFEKVEQFVICAADETESARWHAELLGTAEHILQALELAYEVVECATGDMGLGKFRMNDVNTWFPSLERYRETHSCSTLHDWQARRANIRYKDSDGKIRFAHTLNNTAVATPRLLAAIMENNQTADAQIRVPKVLRPYLGDRDLL
jgi:seryl-tRNA synthetase